MHLPPKNHREKEYHDRLRKVLAFIQENLAADLSLASMAEVANFSPFHFQKLFTRHIGESPKKYVLRLRLERIAHKLKLYPQLSVFELSLQSGFASASTLGRSFKNHYGISPDDFRKLSPSEMSKICTPNNNKGTESPVKTDDFWTVNSDETETNSNRPASKMEVIKQRSLKVAFIDSHLGNETAISNAFKTLYNIANPRELITEDTHFIGIFLDLPFFTELNKCRYRACITLSEDIEIPKGIAIYNIPEGRYAVYSVSGNLNETLKSLVEFKHEMLDNSGYQVAETIGYEEYQVNPAIEDYTPLKRKVFIPVKPA